MEDTNTVVIPVDAEQALATPVVPETPTEPVIPAETVVTPDKPDNNGEAILKEVERREAKLKEKYEQEYTAKAQLARDAVIAEQGHTWNGKPITTEAAYKQAVKDQAAYEELSKKELPPEVIQEMIDSRNFREEAKTKEQKAQEEATKTRNAQEFIEAYPGVKAEDIPASVWQEVDKGKSLVDAYARHENLTLKQQIAEITKAKEIEALNEQNAQSSTGSVTGQGGALPSQYFTLEQVQKMSQAEVDKNYKAIMESQKKWYK